jgi:CRISPR/Cas system-associated protein endoribonuclease Cas2
MKCYEFMKLSCLKILQELQYEQLHYLHGNVILENCSSWKNNNFELKKMNIYSQCGSWPLPTLHVK